MYIGDYIRNNFYKINGLPYENAMRDFDNLIYSITLQPMKQGIVTRSRTKLDSSSSSKTKIDIILIMVQYFIFVHGIVIPDLSPPNQTGGTVSGGTRKRKRASPSPPPPPPPPAPSPPPTPSPSPSPTRSTPSSPSRVTSSPLVYTYEVTCRLLQPNVTIIMCNNLGWPYELVPPIMNYVFDILLNGINPSTSSQEILYNLQQIEKSERIKMSTNYSKQIKNLGLLDHDLPGRQMSYRYFSKEDLYEWVESRYYIHKSLFVLQPRLGFNPIPDLLQQTNPAGYKKLDDYILIQIAIQTSSLLVYYVNCVLNIVPLFNACGSYNPDYSYISTEDFVLLLNSDLFISLLKKICENTLLGHNYTPQSVKKSISKVRVTHQISDFTCKILKIGKPSNQGNPEVISYSTKHRSLLLMNKKNRSNTKYVIHVNDNCKQMIPFDDSAHNPLNPTTAIMYDDPTVAADSVVSNVPQYDSSSQRLDIDLLSPDLLSPDLLSPVYDGGRGRGRGRSSVKKQLVVKMKHKSNRLRRINYSKFNTNNKNLKRRKLNITRRR